MTRPELRRQLEIAVKNAPVSWVVAGQAFVKFSEQIFAELDKLDALEERDRFAAERRAEDLDVG